MKPDAVYRLMAKWLTDQVRTDDVSAKVAREQERQECLRIASTPGMTPQDIVRAIRDRSNG